MLPIVEGADSLFPTVLDSSILEEALSENGTEGLREFEHFRDDSRARQEDMTVLELEASPAFTNNHEIWDLLPKSLAHLNEEGVRIGLYGVCSPVSAILISDHNLTI